MQKLAVIGLLLLDDGIDEDTDDLTHTLIETIRDEWDLEDGQVHLRIVTPPTDLTIGKLNDIVTGVAD